MCIHKYTHIDICFFFPVVCVCVGIYVCAWLRVRIDVNFVWLCDNACVPVYDGIRLHVWVCIYMCVRESTLTSMYAYVTRERERGGYVIVQLCLRMDVFTKERNRLDRHIKTRSIRPANLFSPSANKIISLNQSRPNEIRTRTLSSSFFFFFIFSLFTFLFSFLFFNLFIFSFLNHRLLHSFSLSQFIYQSLVKWYEIFERLSFSPCSYLFINLSVHIYR